MSEFAIKYSLLISFHFLSLSLVVSSMLFDYDVMCRHVAFHLALAGCLVSMINGFETASSDRPTLSKYNVTGAVEPTTGSNRSLSWKDQPHDLIASGSWKQLLFQSKRKQRPRMLGTLYTNLDDRKPTPNVQIKYFDGNSLLNSLVLRPTFMHSNNHHNARPSMPSIEATQPIAITSYPNMYSSPSRLPASYGSPYSASSQSVLTGQSVPGHTLHTLLQHLLIPDHQPNGPNIGTILSGRPILASSIGTNRRKKTQATGRLKSIDQPKKYAHQMNLLDLTSPALLSLDTFDSSPVKYDEQLKQMDAINTLATLHEMAQLTGPPIDHHQSHSPQHFRHPSYSNHHHVNHRQHLPHLNHHEVAALPSFSDANAFPSSTGPTKRRKPNDSIDSLIFQLIQESDQIMSAPTPSTSDSFGDQYFGSNLDLEGEKDFDFISSNYGSKRPSYESDSISSSAFDKLDSALNLADKVSIEDLLLPLTTPSHTSKQKTHSSSQLTKGPEPPSNSNAKESYEANEHDQEHIPEAPLNDHDSNEDIVDRTPSEDNVPSADRETDQEDAPDSGSSSSDDTDSASIGAEHGGGGATGDDASNVVSSDYDYAKYAPDAQDEDDNGAEPNESSEFSSDSSSDGANELTKSEGSFKSAKQRVVNREYQRKSSTSSTPHESSIVDVNDSGKMTPKFDEILRRKNLQTGIEQIANRSFVPRNQTQHKSRATDMQVEPEQVEPDGVTKTL